MKCVAYESQVTRSGGAPSDDPKRHPSRQSDQTDSPWRRPRAQLARSFVTSPRARRLRFCDARKPAPRSHAQVFVPVALKKNNLKIPVFTPIRPWPWLAPFHEVCWTDQIRKQSSAPASALLPISLPTRALALFTIRSPPPSGLSLRNDESRVQAAPRETSLPAQK